MTSPCVSHELQSLSHGFGRSLESGIWRMEAFSALSWKCFQSSHVRIAYKPLANDGEIMMTAGTAALSLSPR